MSGGRTVIVNELLRTPESGPEDHLKLTPGVNVLVGPPNTGKTKWLQMLDFIFGNDEDAASVFGEDVARKYTSVHTRMTVAGETWEVERGWESGTPKNRVVVNGESTNVRNFLHRLLEQLSIPVLHYPQGNPYGQRSWPELGWRSLYRHMYRRQLLWSDIADKQPESEQHACLVQFTGLAKQLFSAEYGELVSLEKRIIALQAQKEQFLSVLAEISENVLSSDGIGDEEDGISEESLESARQRLRLGIDELSRDREEHIRKVREEQLRDDGDDGSETEIDKLSEELSHLEVEQEELRVGRERNRSRLEEMTEYQSSVQHEVQRLKRAKMAGVTLADLKVTHCPVCDRPVSEIGSDSNCYLCGRPRDSHESEDNLARLDLEIEHASAVLAEANEMVAVLERDLQRIDSELAHLRIRIQEVRGLLRPVRSAAAAIMPPEIGVLDMKVGQLQEQLSQIERLSHTLKHQDVLTKKVEEIENECANLEEEVARQSAELDFDRASDLLEEGMNAYLTLIQRTAPTSWTQKPVRVRIDEKKARFLVGEQKKWSSQLGGTLTLYFLISYHYALMKLVEQDECNFPGFLALDFPAELPDGSSIRDAENFVLEPYVALLKLEAYSKCQVIAAGGAFEGLEGANRIEVSKVWA